MKLPPWKTLPASLALASLLLSPSLFGAGLVTATQTVTITTSEVALLRILGAAPPAFTIIAPATAGAIPVISTDTADRFLQYTSIVADGETRSITVQHNEDMPVTLTLKLALVENVGPGSQGTTGSRKFATLDLTEGAQVAIKGIESGYTGTEATDGWKFTYSLVIMGANAAETSTSFAGLPAFVSEPIVTYTLTAGT